MKHTFMSMPPEIRAMVFSYFLPRNDKVSKSALPTSLIPLMVLNREIHDEIPKNVFVTRPFTFVVTERSISIGKTWPSNLRARLPSKEEGADGMQLFGSTQKYFQHIAKWKVKIQFDGDPSLYARRDNFATGGPAGLSHLYFNVLRLVRFLHSVYKLTQLHVSATFVGRDWDPSEVYAAARYVTEPFMTLCKINSPGIIAVALDTLRPHFGVSKESLIWRGNIRGQIYPLVDPASHLRDNEEGTDPFTAYVQDWTQALKSGSPKRSFPAAAHSAFEAFEELAQDLTIYKIYNPASDSLRPLFHRAVIALAYEVAVLSAIKDSLIAAVKDHQKRRFDTSQYIIDKHSRPQLIDPEASKPAVPKLTPASDWPKPPSHRTLVREIEPNYDAGKLVWDEVIQHGNYDMGGAQLRVPPELVHNLKISGSAYTDAM